MADPDEHQPSGNEAALELASRVAAGDRAAATTMVVQVMPAVRAVARRLTASEADAGDGAQVALLEILRAASGYSGRGSLRGWARTVAARAILRWRRRVAARPDAASIGAAPPTAQPSTAVIDELPRPLSSYLDRLTDVQREAVALRFVAQCTIPEISEITAAPVPTVKSRIAAGMNRLRKDVRRDLELGVRAS